MNDIDNILSQLQDGLKDLYESEKYKQYLDTMAKFPNYSSNNCRLIAMQKPDATYVASYSAWKNKFHRQVMKGEKGISIIAPVPYKKEIKAVTLDQNGEMIFDESGSPVMKMQEYTGNRFRICKVFDVSQTEGDPLPSISTKLENPVDGYYDYIEAIKSTAPVPVKFGNISNGASGYYSAKKQEIMLQRGMSESQTIKTLLHECAHARLGHGSVNDHFDRNSREVQAESIAYCCSKALGLDTSEYSFGYIAAWSSKYDQKVLSNNLEIIRSKSHEILTEIHEKLNVILEERKVQHGISQQEIEPEKRSIRVSFG